MYIVIRFLGSYIVERHVALAHTTRDKYFDITDHFIYAGSGCPIGIIALERLYILNLGVQYPVKAMLDRNITSGIIAIERLSIPNLEGQYRFKAIDDNKFLFLNG